MSLAVGAAPAGAFLLWGEVVSVRASSRGVTEGHTGARRAVLVLGFGNCSDRANAVNRYRVRAGLRTLRAPEDRLIMSGGAVRGSVPEARILAEYAVRKGYRGRILTETESRSTWENIRNSIPLLDDAQEIAIVSNSLHAEKARGFLRQQRPDLGRRLIRAEEYRFGEVPVIKALAAALALVERRRSRVSMNGPAGDIEEESRMPENHVAMSTITIDTTAGRVWAVITDPDATREFMFGTTMRTDWKVGSPITWRGTWEGRDYEDKGTVLEVVPGRRLSYTHFSPLTGEPDQPENYHTLTWTITGERPVVLALSQDNNKTPAAAAHSQQMWDGLVGTVKEIAERGE